MFFIYKLANTDKAVQLVKEFNDNYNNQPFLDGYCRFIVEGSEIIVVQQMIPTLIFSPPKLLIKLILRYKLSKVGYEGKFELLNKKDTIKMIGVLLWGNKKS
jgi:hypothetical protein